MEPNLSVIRSTEQFFYEQLQAAMRREHVSLSGETQVYLLHLLGRIRADSKEQLYGRLLIKEFWEADVQTDLERLQRVGDVCLLLVGLFWQSLTRKMVDPDYYCTVGVEAYARLPEDHFTELSEKFVAVSDVLNALNEAYWAGKPENLIRLYEAWLRNPTPQRAAILQRHGITPIALKGRKRTH